MKSQVRVLEGGGGAARIAARGLFWLLAQMAGGRALSFLSQIILAHLLSPQDFGTIGLTYTLTTIVGSLTASGIENVLLQRSRTLHTWAWPGFWINMALSLIGAGLILALAPVAAGLYAAPEVEGLAAILALAMPLSALSMLPTAAVRAALNFRLLATIGAAELVAAQILTILLAWHGMGPYSFVIPFPIIASVKAAWLWATIRPRMRPARPRRAWWYLVKSGSWIWAFRLLAALISQGDYFVLGLFASRAEVGFYFLAFRLSFQPLEALAGNFQNVMFPVLSQLRSQQDEQYRKALRGSEYLAIIVFFYGFLQAAVAAPVLHLLFHDKWNGSIPLVQVLSLALPFDAVPWIAAALLEARGEFRTKLIRYLIASPWFFVLVWLGARWDGALGVAIAVGLFYVIYGPWYSYLAMRGSAGGGLSGIARIYVLPVVLSGSAVAVGWTIAHAFFSGENAVAQILFTFVLATLTYAGLLRGCLPETFSALRTHIASALRRGR